MHERKTGEELEIGDVIATAIDQQPTTIIGFDNHPRENARVLIASSNYRITIFNGDHFRKTTDGMFISLHHWFPYEQKK